MVIFSKQPVAFVDNLKLKLALESLEKGYNCGSFKAVVFVDAVNNKVKQFETVRI